MTAPSYRIETLDLSVARDNVPIVDPGLTVTSVTALDDPTGLGVGVAFRAGAQPITLEWQGFTLDLCPPANEGLYVTNAAVGGTLRVLVVFGGVDVMGGVA